MNYNYNYKTIFKNHQRLFELIESNIRTSQRIADIHISKKNIIDSTKDILMNLVIDYNLFQPKIAENIKINFDNPHTHKFPTISFILERNDPILKIEGSSFNAGYYDNFLEILQKYQKEAIKLLYDYLILLALEFGVFYTYRPNSPFSI